MKVQIIEKNTTPLILHGNGKSSREPHGAYNLIIREFFSKETPISLEEDLDLTIVTWKGGKYKNTETILEKFMRFYDFPLLILDWPENKNFWEGSKAKDTTTLKAIKNKTIKTKYVLWLDAGDVILLEHPKYILEKFKEISLNTGTKIIFNAEKNNYPKPNRMNNISPKVMEQWNKTLANDENNKGPFKYLNSGVLIGETKELEKLLETSSNIGPNDPINDTVQCRIAQYLHKDTTTIDTNTDIFACLYDVERSDVKILN